MDIGLATLADYAEVADLLRESKSGFVVAPDHMEDCLLLRSGRNLVGMAHVRVLETYALGLCLVVRPGFRRLGLGKQLGQAMLAHSRKRSVSRLFVYSDEAPFYFRTLGFRPVEPARIPGQVAEFLLDLREGVPLIGGHLLEFRLRAHDHAFASAAELKAMH